MQFDNVELTSLKGSDLREMRPRMQMIFQDPISSLNPRRRVGDIVAEGLEIWKIGDKRVARGEGRRSARARSGLDPEITKRRRPHEFSGGQCQRISIAAAVVTEPKLIICDEPVSALDVSVQAQILNLLEEMKQRYQLTLVFIAHDLAVVKNVSDRVAVMYLGKLCEVAAPDLLYAQPAHPYTAALLAAIPVPDPDSRPDASTVLGGEIPSPTNPPSGCRFRTRCPKAQARCAEEEPQLRPAAPGQFVACHFPLQPGEQLEFATGHRANSLGPWPASRSLPVTPPRASASGRSSPTSARRCRGSSSAVATRRLLPPRVLEAARMTIAHINGCNVCMAWRVPAFAKHGVTEELYAHVDEPDHDEYSAAERLAIEYAPALRHRPPLDRRRVLRAHARAVERRRDPRAHDPDRRLARVRPPHRGARSRPGVRVGAAHRRLIAVRPCGHRRGTPRAPLRPGRDERARAALPAARAFPAHEPGALLRRGARTSSRCLPSWARCSARVQLSTAPCPTTRTGTHARAGEAGADAHVAVIVTAAQT